MVDVGSRERTQSGPRETCTGRAYCTPPPKLAVDKADFNTSSSDIAADIASSKDLTALTLFPFESVRSFYGLNSPSAGFAEEWRGLRD